MSERNELTERDQELLNKVEKIVANGGGEQREADSLYGFCAHLASTVPQADDAFRQRLETRLVAGMQQQKEVRTLGAMSQDKGEARSPSWFQRLAQGVGRIRQIFQVRGGLTMKKGFALAALAALVMAVSMVAFVPSVRAQVGEVLNTWFHFKSPGGEYGVSLGGAMEFTPLDPTYLPAGLESSGGGISVLGTFGEESIELEYHNDEQFVSIAQTKAPAEKALPAGREVTVNGQPAVLVAGLEGTFEYGFHIPEDALVGTSGTPSAPIEVLLRSQSITYTDGKRLTWYAGDVKVEMLSNLSEEEMLKIAESLVAAEGGEAPFQMDLDLPSGGEEKVIETEGGRIIIHEGPIESSP